MSAYRFPADRMPDIPVRRTEPGEFPFTSRCGIGPFSISYWSWVVYDSREGIMLYLDFGLTPRIGQARGMTIEEAKAQRAALDHAIQEAERLAR